MYLIWYTLTYFYFSISFWLINLLINDTELPSLNCVTSFGQLLCLLIISIPKLQNDRVQPQKHVYTLIKSVKLINPTTDGIKYYEDFGSMEVINLNQVRCVIGRIVDHGRWAIVDCSTSSARPHVTK
jgi:hypothetical protein